MHTIYMKSYITPPCASLLWVALIHSIISPCDSLTVVGGVALKATLFNNIYLQGTLNSWSVTSNGLLPGLRVVGPFLNHLWAFHKWLVLPPRPQEPTAYPDLGVPSKGSWHKRHSLKRKDHTLNLFVATGNIALFLKYLRQGTIPHPEKWTS